MSVCCIKLFGVEDREAPINSVWLTKQAAELRISLLDPFVLWQCKGIGVGDKPGLGIAVVFQTGAAWLDSLWISKERASDRLLSLGDPRRWRVAMYLARDYVPDPITSAIEYDQALKDETQRKRAPVIH